MPATPFPRLILAGNRPIAIAALELFREAGWTPVAVIVSRLSPDAPALRSAAEAVGIRVLDERVLQGEEGLATLRELAPDLLLSVHYPHIFSEAVLAIPRMGALNLHPAYLPYNRGWHTPSWAILDGTPFGATLHWMTADLDAGPIAIQRRLAIAPDDTADSLYQKALALELDLLRDALPRLADGTLPRIAQVDEETLHHRRDLEARMELDLDAPTTARAVLTQLRALTTNRWEEAAWFEVDGKRYRARVEVREDREPRESSRG